MNQQFNPRRQQEGRRKAPRVLLGVTGSVAAVKAPEIAVRLVTEFQADVKVLLSSGGRNFWDKAVDYDRKSWEKLNHLLASSNEEAFSEGNGSRIQLHSAEEEWQDWHRLGDPVLHIDLRDWADVFLIAPLSAHTLAKLAHGLCDDTLSCVARAWDFGHGERPGKPLLLAPAMNTAMWQHPLTMQQIETIRSFWKDDNFRGIHIIEPAAKTLACGEVGVGALASVDDILETVDRSWKSIKRLEQSQVKSR